MIRGLHSADPSCSICTHEGGLRAFAAHEFGDVIPPVHRNELDEHGQWFHGTNYDPKNGDLKTADERGENSTGWRHWNTHLGTHFTSVHATAKKFATREFDPIHARIAHASLHMESPLHYKSENHMTDDAFRWARKNGFKDYDQHTDGETGERSVREYDETPEDHHWLNKDLLSRSGDAEGWLASHPRIGELADGFKKHLQSQGVDGITYGNEHEEPIGHTSAIAFKETPVKINQWEKIHAPADRGTKVASLDEDDKYNNLSFQHHVSDGSDDELRGTEVITAHHLEHGQVGKLTYLDMNHESWTGYPERAIHINMLRANMNHRRRGVATQMMQHLEQRYPDVPIDHGTRTRMGEQWGRAMYGRQSKPSPGHKFFNPETQREEPTHYDADWTLNGKPWSVRSRRFLKQKTAELNQPHMREELIAHAEGQQQLYKPAGESMYGPGLCAYHANEHNQHRSTTFSDIGVHNVPGDERPEEKRWLSVGKGSCGTCTRHQNEARNRLPGRPGAPLDGPRPSPERRPRPGSYYRPTEKSLNDPYRREPVPFDPKMFRGLDPRMNTRTFPGSHPEQLHLHPDLGHGMDEMGLYKGSPQLPLYRGIAVPDVHEDALEHLGKSHEHDQAIAHHLMDRIDIDHADRGHRTRLGIHWSHDLDASQDLANTAHQEWNNGGEHGHPVVLEADHPGHEHVIDFSDPMAAQGGGRPDKPSKDWHLTNDTIGPHSMQSFMLPEVPVRPGAPLHLRAIHVQKPNGDFHRIPIGLHTKAMRKDAVKYTVQIDHGKRNENAQPSPEGPVTPPYLQHSHTTHAIVDVHPWDEHGNQRPWSEMDNEAIRTAHEMSSGSRGGRNSDMILGTKILKIEAVQKSAADKIIHHMPVREFQERYQPAEYDSHGLGWDGVDEHPAFFKKNPMNPKRIHGGTWSAFVEHVRQHGIQEPVEVEHWEGQPEGEPQGEVVSGHHRVKAAEVTGHDVPFVIINNNKVGSKTAEIEDGHWFLYHGTNEKNAESIAEHGFQHGQGESNGQHSGAGFYFHEHPRQAAQYGDHLVVVEATPRDFSIHHNPWIDPDVDHNHVSESLMRQGYDGHRDPDDGAIVLYHPHQIHYLTHAPKEELISGKTAKRFTPTKRVFTHTCGLDHRLWDANGKLKPEVRKWIMGTIRDMWSRYNDWSKWSIVYFAGSEASEWTSPELEGNNDFDVLVGVDYDKFRQYNPTFAGLDNQAITDMFNDGFRAYNGPVMLKIDGKETGPWDRTTYVNPDSYDITKIKPYAAYNVSDDKWVVKSPHLPHWSLSSLPKSVQRVLRAAADYANEVLSLPEPERTQQGNALFQAWHSDRSRAFGPNGEGWWDIANLREKWLDQEGTWAQLTDCAHRWNKGLGAAPKDWNNTPKFASYRQDAINPEVHWVPTEHAMNWHSAEYDVPMHQVEDEMHNIWKHDLESHTHEDDPWVQHGGPRQYIRHLRDQIQSDGGIHTPIQVGPDGVEDGHHRLISAHQLGIKEVPVWTNGGFPKQAMGQDHIATTMLNQSRHWGAGLHSLFPEDEDGAHPVAGVPFPQAGARRDRHLYDKDLVARSITHPHEFPVEEVDPRMLHATQPKVLRAGVKHYLDNGTEGRTYGEDNGGDRRLGNDLPRVYHHLDTDRYIILSGHHRATSQLLKGEPLKAVVIRGGWGQARGGQASDAA